MDVQQLKDDAAAGKLSVEKLIDVIVAQQKRIAELEALVKGKNPTSRTDEPYSEKAEDKRKQDKKGKQGKKSGKSKPDRRGRVSTADKKNWLRVPNKSIHKVSNPTSADFRIRELLGQEFLLPPLICRCSLGVILP